MKKIILIIFILLLLGCSKEKEDIIIELDNKMEFNVNSYHDDNPIKVGLYDGNKLIKDYSTKITNMKDIGYFNVYYTQDDTLISKNIKTNWYNYYNKYNDIDKYKIGFNISFTTKEKTINEQILDVDCEFLLAPYLYIYIYDGVNQKDGTWYSHLLPSQVNDKTIFESIKLFMADRATDITSSIKLEVFTYDEDDFNEDNKYIGNSRYLVEIKQLEIE